MTNLEIDTTSLSTVDLKTKDTGESISFTGHANLERKGKGALPAS